MQNQEFKVTISGLTPYMQHRMDDVTLEEWEKNRGAIIERKEISDPDQKRAEFHCYRDENDQCFLPSEHLKGSFINAGSFLKSKVGNSRKSMKNIVAAMFYINPDKVVMPDYDTIDKRSAVNKNVKARVMVIRPKWTDWKVSFDLTVANNTITKDTVKEIIEYAGNYCGVGSFRPTNNGQFGRFKIDEIKKK
jgi:hypothetical protein